MRPIYAELQSSLDALSATGNLRTLPHTAQEGRYLYAEGQRMLNLSSNDYLGLAADTALREDFLRHVPTRDLVFSSGSSRLLTGNHPVFDELETALARLYGAESALLFNSGYDANTGITAALSDPGTLVLADKLVHASLIDGIRLGRGTWKRFRHNDLDDLERLLKQEAHRYKRILLVVESIYSMDGDMAPLEGLVALRRQYPHALLYVDEAHAFGIRGPQGLGLCEEKGILADIDLLIGTLGKAAGSAGAFVVCRRVMRDYLVNHVRPFIFTTALPPVVAAWTLCVLRRLPAMSARRLRLQTIARRVHEALGRLSIPDKSATHIIPLPVGDSAEAVRRAHEMQRQGFYVRAIRPPTVPPGTSRLRLSLRADLTDDELDALLASLGSLFHPDAARISVTDS